MGGSSVNVDFILYGSNGRIHRVAELFGRVPHRGAESRPRIPEAKAQAVGEGEVEAVAQMARETTGGERGCFGDGPLGQVTVLDAEAAGGQAAALY